MIRTLACYHRHHLADGSFLDFFLWEGDRAGVEVHDAPGTRRSRVVEVTVQEVGEFRGPLDDLVAAFVEESPAEVARLTVDFAFDQRAVVVVTQGPVPRMSYWPTAFPERADEAARPGSVFIHLQVRRAGFHLRPQTFPLSAGASPSPLVPVDSTSWPPAPAPVPPAVPVSGGHLF